MTGFFHYALDVILQKSRTLTGYRGAGTLGEWRSSLPKWVRVHFDKFDPLGRAAVLREIPIVIVISHNAITIVATFLAKEIYGIHIIVLLIYNWYHWCILVWSCSWDPNHWLIVTKLLARFLPFNRCINHNLKLGSLINEANFRVHIYVLSFALNRLWPPPAQLFVLRLKCKFLAPCRFLHHQLIQPLILSLEVIFTGYYLVGKVFSFIVFVEF